MPQFIIDEVINVKKDLELELSIAKNEKKLEKARQLEFRLKDVKAFLAGCF